MRRMGVHVPDATHWAGRVGSRVVVRRRLAGGGLGDVLGELEEARDGLLRVRTSHGVVEVRLDDVVTGKVVPPRAQRAAPPHRALSVVALEGVMADHWRALESEALGDWLLRASRGFTGRGNSVLAVGDPGRPRSGPSGAVETVTAWYAGRGLPPMASLPAPLGEGPGRGTAPPAGGAGPVASAAEAESLAANRAAFDRAGWREREGAGAVVLTA